MFVITIKCSRGRLTLCLPPSLLEPSEKRPSFILAKKRKYLGTLKEKFTDLLESCQGIPYSHRQSRKGMENTFVMVKITPICKR